MFRSIPALAASVLLGALPPSAAARTDSAPPTAPLADVSEPLRPPDFLPRRGTLHVDPANLPAGPFLDHDRDGKLSATICMTPIEDLEGGTTFNDRGVGNGYAGGDRLGTLVVVEHHMGMRLFDPVMDDRRAARRDPLRPVQDVGVAGRRGLAVACLEFHEAACGKRGLTGTVARAPVSRDALTLTWGQRLAGCA